MRPFGIIELERVGYGMEHRERCAGNGAPLKLRVILNAYACQSRNFGAPQPCNPPVGANGKSGALRGYFGPPRHQERADFGSVVQVKNGSPLTRLRMGVRDALSVHVLSGTPQEPGAVVALTLWPFPLQFPPRPRRPFHQRRSAACW